MDKLKSDVISAIRSCLVSTKGRVQLRQLDSDYRMLVGGGIPYSKLGFNRLEDFLQSEPSFTLIKTANGEIFVDSKLSEKSIHISELILKQKPSNNKKVLKKGARLYTPYVPQTSVWRPKVPNIQNRRFHTSARPAAVSHNQFVSRMQPKRPAVASKIVIPDTSSFAINNHQKQTSTRLRQEDKGLHRTNLEEKKLDNHCSALSNAKKRITKKMSEISLDRDSGNSSPVNEMMPIGQGQLARFSEFVPDKNDPIKSLKNFVEIFKIGEIEMSSKRVQTKHNRLFTCKIKVICNKSGTSHLYTSYPKEFVSNLKAEEYCAEEALKDLLPKYGRRKSLLQASDKDILDRVPHLVEKHNHGIWGWQLVLDYADKYNEELPADWLKIIDTSPCIQVEKCLDNYVLRYCNPGDKGQKWNTSMALSDVSVPSNTVQIGDEGKFVAEVTCIMSANEIWCRQLSTEESDRYDEMISLMENYYEVNEQKLKAESIAEAGYYAVVYDNAWYRVRAVAKYERDVRCFFIDYGDEMSIANENIRQLRREFATCQAQAFVCRLVGLEELYEASTTSQTLQELLYRQVVLEMSSESNVDGNVFDLSIPVFMYDFKTGSSINQELIPLLTIESATPFIQKASITDVYVSHAESNGDVYVQVRSRGYDTFVNLLQSLELEVTQKPPVEHLPVTRGNSQDKLFLGRSKADGRWCRVKIIDWCPQGDLAQIYYIDHGHTDVIDVVKDVMHPLEKLSDILSQYPAQALRVKMALNPLPPHFVQTALKIMPKDQPVLLKIISYDEQKVPLVEFFKRNSEGGLFCINKSISIELELIDDTPQPSGNNAEQRREDGNNNSKPSKRKLQFESVVSKNVPSGGTLPRPPLPKPGEFLEVYIPFAVNPYNFFIQPLLSKGKLHELMERLQERYKDVLYSPLTVDLIKPGNIYASKHDDGHWYRTSVIKVIHSGSISVFYCDFGYYNNLTVQQLIPLDVEFMQLPYQALKAKISDIKPKQSKWTMDDCEAYKDLVEKKQLYSVLQGIERDQLYDSDIVLNLILVDTSSDADIIIGEELIKKGIAVPV